LLGTLLSGFSAYSAALGDGDHRCRPEHDEATRPVDISDYAHPASTYVVARMWE